MYYFQNLTNYYCQMQNELSEGGRKVLDIDSGKTVADIYSSFNIAYNSINDQYTKVLSVDYVTPLKDAKVSSASIVGCEEAQVVVKAIWGGWSITKQCMNNAFVTLAKTNGTIINDIAGAIECAVVCASSSSEEVEKSRSREQLIQKIDLLTTFSAMGASSIKTAEDNIEKFGNELVQLEGFYTTIRDIYLKEFTLNSKDRKLINESIAEMNKLVSEYNTKIALYAIIAGVTLVATSVVVYCGAVPITSLSILVCHAVISTVVSAVMPKLVDLIRELQAIKARLTALIELKKELWKNHELLTDGYLAIYGASNRAKYTQNMIAKMLAPWVAIQKDLTALSEKIATCETIAYAELEAQLVAVAEMWSVISKHCTNLTALTVYSMYKEYLVVDDSTSDQQVEEFVNKCAA